MYSEGFAAEIWFRLRMQDLRMIEPQPPTITEVKQVLLHYFARRSQRAIAHMQDAEDPAEWLDLILKVDVLLQVQNLEGESLRIAVDVTTNPTEALAKLEMIQSPLFRSARRELKIAQHWVVIVSSPTPPSRDRLMDIIYEQVDKGLEWDILNI